MKLIISRKGFDSESGGIASPIMPNGDLLSMPIPEEDARDTYQSLKYCNDTYEKILKDLGYNGPWKCHLDPDIYNLKNQSGWEALFGQSGAAAGHLKNQKIFKNDIFLYFGTFREVDVNNGIYTFKEKTKEMHIIYGYLQVESIIKEGISKYHWHPHSDPKYIRMKSNTIFTASKYLLNTDLPGYGTFKFSDKLILTKPGNLISQWILPEVLKDKDITYHRKQRAFKDDYFQSACRGQEFVIDCDSDNNVIEWIKKLVD